MRDPKLIYAVVAPLLSIASLLLAITHFRVTSATYEERPGPYLIGICAFLSVCASVAGQFTLEKQNSTTKSKRWQSIVLLLSLGPALLGGLVAALMLWANNLDIGWG